MTAKNASEGSWLETIALFEQARAGDHLTAMRLLETSSEPTNVVHGLLRMFAVFLRGEDQEKLDRFLEASLNAGPPPLHFPLATQPTTLNKELGEKLRQNKS